VRAGNAGAHPPNSAPAGERATGIEPGKSVRKTADTGAPVALFAQLARFASLAPAGRDPAANADRYRLALVCVSPGGSDQDEIRYLLDPFTGFDCGDFAADGVRGDWAKEWAKGGPPA